MVRSQGCNDQNDPGNVGQGRQAANAKTFTDDTKYSKESYARPKK